jgi:hypothetical protein
MPKSKNRKNHKAKVNNFKNRKQQNRKNIEKWLTALQEINAQNAVKPEYNYVHGSYLQAPEIMTVSNTPQITPIQYGNDTMEI